MGRKCNVEGCQSDSNRPKDVGVTFHKVPPHNDIRPKWLSLCKIPGDKKYMKVIYVCSRHFLRADFCNFKGKKYMLRQGVLPSVFPWDKSKLEAIKAEAKKEKSVEIKEEHIVTVKEEPLDVEEEIIERKIKQEIVDNEYQQSLESNIKLEPKQESEVISDTTPLPSSITPLTFMVNSKVEALDFNNEWYPATIVEIDYEENEVFIHFENFSSKYDEWISMNSSRLRALQSPDVSSVPPTITNTVVKKEKSAVDIYSIGERCLAAWSNSRKFPATVTKVLENDMYEVLFDDGFVKAIKAHRMSKAQGKQLQSSPLFDPIKSSKQDRREKKRKLNVAALFRKKRKLDHSEEKPKKSQTPTSTVVNSTPPPEVQNSAQLEMPSLLPSALDIENWKPSWYKGKPMGIEATLQTNDGPKVSYIVPDPRLPAGWNKHILRKTKGCDAGKWDTIIVSPDNKRLRSKTDVLKYIEEHPNGGVNEKMFDFSFVSRRKRKNPITLPPAKSPRKSPEIEDPPSVGTLEKPIDQPEVHVNEEDTSTNSLKILFEDDAYKCPIEGCGKIFRRENLAQMHVKHYHPEYTKFLDSTPNVADLAYARTVGENLDRSPGPQKPPLKLNIKTSTPKTPKHSSSFGIEEIPDLKSQVKPKLPPTPKTKDQEIIKLLNTKPYIKSDGDGLQQQQPPPSTAMPASPYADIKLKDLLTKSENIPNMDELTLKHLLKSKPSTGIKTLLPVHRTQNESSGGEPSLEYRIQLKRKCGYAENIEIVKGGEVIKIVRMKLEEIINCTCGFMEEDGLMIQCELCLCWQHAYCNNIERECQVPDKYVCYICQNPLRERMSRKYYHDQDWLTKGVLPVGSYHTKDDDVLHKRFDKLKKCHDLSGGLIELGQYQHSLKIKMKISEAKNHPKLYLWSKPWPKLCLPEKGKPEFESKPKRENEDQEFLKNDFDVEKDSQNENSMLMMILKAGKGVMPKLDLNSLMDNNSPMIPQPEAVIDSADCRLNLLEHLVHQYSLVEERMDDFEKQIDCLEEGMNIEKDFDCPKTRSTMQMVMRDLETLKELSRSSAL